MKYCRNIVRCLRWIFDHITCFKFSQKFTVRFPKILPSMRIVVINWIKSLRERRHLYIHVNRVASGFTDRALISRGSGFDARNRVKLKGHQCRTPSRSNISTNYFRVATEETKKNFIRSYRRNAYTWKRANIRRIL